MRLTLLSLLLIGASTTFAQTPITYSLDLENIQHHELNIRIDFPALPPAPLVVRMPTSSPGRYAIHSFAKNVYGVKAYDVAGRALEVARTGLNEWTVSGHGGSARFEYILFANHADGTYSGVDNLKLHLNMPATFAYGVGLDERPIHLMIPQDQQPEWSVATQLEALGNRIFRAPNYYYFFDSPTFVGDIRFRSWTIASDDRVDTIQMAFLTPDPDSLLDSYAEWTKSIVDEQARVYGGLPAFDFNRYTFLCAYNPYVIGDGMEHRNSTICSSSNTLEKAAAQLIGTISHEFFHAWNVERLRPASLEPFNYDQANLSGELWFAEGFTSYFDDLILTRAGIRSPQEYVKGITGGLNYVLNAPGSRYRSPIEMSHCAPFVDDATSIDPNNFSNTFISYYTYGAVLGLALDLQLRRDFNTDLDVFMRTAWERYGQTEVPYVIPDLEAVLADVSGDDDFARDWFARHIYGREMPDLAALLADFGIQWELREPDQVGFYGLQLDTNDRGLEVVGTVFKNNPLYEAGLEKGDFILGIEELSIPNEESWDENVAELEMGERYTLRYVQNGEVMSGSFTAEASPSFRLIYQEDVKPGIAGRRAAWLNIE